MRLPTIGIDDVIIFLLLLVLLDSVRMMESYADVIVLRHPEAHSAKVSFSFQS